MQKLTLSVDDVVISGAKRYAAARGTSVSRLVETMLHLVSTSAPETSAPPVLAKLRGSLKRGSVSDYRRYLGEVPVKRFLVDVNLILDVLLDRRPHTAAASAVWTAVEDGRAEGLLSAHAVTTIHYLNAKAVGGRTARETTDAVLSVFSVAAVDDLVVRAALTLGWRDFEDAVTAAAARQARCAAIVTRNPRDFTGSPVRVVTPAEANAWLQMAG